VRSQWQETKLGDILSRQYGKPLPKKDRMVDGLYPVYGANGVKCYANRFYYDQPSIVVGRKGSAGEVNLTDGKFWPLDVTYFVKHDERQHDLKFLFYLLSLLDLPSLAKGVKPGINRNEVYGIDVSSPPLPEQKRIVEILDEAFEAIDKAIANTERNISNAEELFESKRDSVFTKADSRWKSSTLGDICRIQRGGSPRPIKQYLTEREDGINWIKIADASAGHKYITNTRQKIISEGIQRSRLVHPGEFLLSNSMSFGRPYILRIEGCIHDGWLVLGDFQNELTEDYLYHFLSSGEAKLQLERLAVGSTVRNLNTKSVSKVSIRYPEMKEQSVICAHLDSLDARSRDLVAKATAKKLLLDVLKQSILQKAFTGELTKDYREVENALTEAGA